MDQKNRKSFCLATILSEGEQQAALLTDGAYFPIGDLQPLLRGVSVKALLAEWDSAFVLLEELVQGAEGGIPVSEATLLTPILYPDKLLAVGANYSGHLEEMGLRAEKWEPMPFFLRPPSSSLVGPGETVRLPKTTQQFDWECELAIVVGKRLKDASMQEAARAIAGYTIGLDLTCRDLVKTDNELGVDLTRGKCQDTMAPCGPHIVPAAYLQDVGNLQITLCVNGEKMMDSNTQEMLFQTDEILSTISHYMTLNPGDIVFTGSPSGSAGVHGGRWLKAGDRIEASIEGVGVLNVTVFSD